MAKRENAGFGRNATEKAAFYAGLTSKCTRYPSALNSIAVKFGYYGIQGIAKTFASIDSELKMIEIRALSAEETHSHIADLSEVMIDCVEGGASIGYMSPYTLDDAAQFWKAVVADLLNNSVLHLAASDEGKIVGTVQVVLKQPPNQPHRGDLKKLMVRTSARGKGVARKLMQAAETAAQDHGKTLLVLDTATGSDAEFIYPKLGWKRVGVIPNYAKFPDGRFCDTTVFYKEL